MTSSRYLAALSLAALLAACGKDSSKNSLDDANDFAAAYADVMCSALVACSCTDPKAKTDCKIAYTEMIKLDGASMLAEYPGVILDKAAVKTCLADFKTALATCPSPTFEDRAPTASSPLALPAAPAPRRKGPQLPRPESCAALYVGTRLEGDYCSSYRECAAGLVCDRDARTCVPAPVEGASCEYTSVGDGDIGCAAGLYCDGEAVCVKLPAAGEACNSRDRHCAEGSECLSVEGEYKCVAPHVADASCADEAGCASGLYCDRGSLTCKTLIADGGDCDSDSDCAHAWCNSEDKCADAGFCSMVGNSAPGPK